jgi:ParB-like chromosome segregation protein Spo0J
VADLDAAEPVTIYEDPGDGERILVNGHHRVAAAQRLGRTSINADVQPGTHIDATLYRDLQCQPY